MMQFARSGGKLLLLAAVLFSLAGCAGHVTRGDEYARKDEWAKAILEYRQAYAADPGNIEIKSRLEQMELQAADYYYHRGLLAEEKGDMDRAIGFFQEALVAMPANEKVQAALRHVQARKDAAAIYREGLNLLAAGKRDVARQRFQQVLRLRRNRVGVVPALLDYPRNLGQSLGVIVAEAAVEFLPGDAGQRLDGGGFGAQMPTREHHGDSRIAQVALPI